MQKVSAVILAAGEGKRMKSKHSKVMHEVLGKALIEWVYCAVREAGIDDCVAIVGHRAEQIKEYMKDKFKYFNQEKQLGTGHAVIQAKDYIYENSEYVLILCGDTPLITTESIENTIKHHIDSGNGATVITAVIPDPTGYGRVVRNEDGNVLKIVEHKDATDKEKKVTEINSGMYCFTTSLLVEALKDLDNNNSQGEYYLTDTIEILINKGFKVGAVKVEDSNEILGINNRMQLCEASEILKYRIMTDLMAQGVTIVSPGTTFIGDEASIGIDTVIMPGTIIEGKTQIGENCILGPNTSISNSQIGDDVKINNSVVLESEIGSNTNIGPFAYIRPKSRIGDNVKIGDFVEVKASKIGDKTKISHLTYVGDAEIGRNVNLGCGVVVVNYDGKTKNLTKIGDNAFVGCNSNLVSPVEIKEDSYIAAGSTITKEVPSESLAIARSKQTVIEGWVTRRGMKRKEK